MSSSHQFCDHCGAENRLQARFCVSCGSSMPSIVTNSTSSPTTIKAQTLSNPAAAVWGGNTSTPINTSHVTNKLSIAPLNTSNANGSFTGRLQEQTLLGQRYRILKLIGRGGMGAVYLVEDTHFGGAPRAIKELSQYGLSPQEAHDATVAFKHEADLLARLVHPNLPRIYDHFNEQGRWYLAMDYISGETLEQRLDKLPRHIMAPLDVLNIALQLCDTLRYLHSQQPPIIFRDLKPANIMLTPDDHVYLIDFGIARLFKPGQTTDTVALGSPGYAAPEQYGRAQTTTSTDIYGLGATLHQLLSGYDPSSDPFQFPALQLTSGPGSNELATLILQMVEMKREKRPATMLEVKQRLQASLSLLQGQQIVGPGLTSAASVRPALTSVPPVHSTKTTIIVDQAGAGQYRTVNEALEELRNSMASDNSTNSTQSRHKVLIHPGVYREKVTLDLPIEIRGVGTADEIILENSDDSCLIIQAEEVAIYGLTLRSYVKKNSNDFYTVDILHGQALLEQCILTGEARACIAIQGNTTNATLRQCKIYGGRKNGILVSKASHATIDNCEIYANTATQVSIREYAEASIHHCKIYDGRDCGIAAHKNGQGTVEDCEIFENVRHGVTVMSEGNLVLKHCVIRANKDGGFASLERGQGSIEQCEIFDNARLGVGVTLGGTLSAHGCKIHDNGSAGIHIYQQGHGVFKNCDIYNNATLGVAIKQEGKPRFLHCTIHHNRDAGVAVVDHGGGIFEDCRIYKNAKLGVGISSQANPTLRRCTIRINEDAGIHVYQAGQGTFERCDIANNHKLGVVISGQADPKIQDCEIHHNNDGGVHVHQDGQGTFINCNIHTNRLSSFAISTGGNPTVQSCKLYASPQDGVYVYSGGRGTFEQCEIFDNTLSGVEIKTNASPIIRACRIHHNRQYAVHAHDNGQGVVEQCYVYDNDLAPWNIHSGGNLRLI